MTTPATKPMVTPVEAVARGFSKYADFGGRATRAEYWWWMLFTSIVSTALNALDRGFGGGILQTVFSLAVLLPTFAVTFRRLHDIGKTGWWHFGWLGIVLISWVTAGIMMIAAAAVKYGHTEGGWPADLSGADLANWDTLSAFTPSIVVLIAAIVSTLVVLVWSIVWLARQGESGQNRFGPDPRI
ncbi:MAG: DUF805 domain-containing protein [Truepera sp.]|nr:DUF805 domain-containing protein [Truepera sp.]